MKYMYKQPFKLFIEKWIDFLQGRYFLFSFRLLKVNSMFDVTL